MSSATPKVQYWTQELNGANLSAFDTFRDETILGTSTEPDTYLLECLYSKQLSESPQMKEFLSRCTQNNVQKGEARSHNKLNNMVEHYLRLQTRQGHVASRERHHVVTPFMHKETSRQEHCHRWFLKSCSRGARRRKTRERQRRNTWQERT